jgi:hypothetical protein
MPSETEEIPPEKEEMTEETVTMSPVTASIPSKIPTNESTNIAWGGCMCEANGFIYYVSGTEGKQEIVRMEQDGSEPETVTAGEYSCLGELTSDGTYLYFVSTVLADDMPDTIYRLPLSGGHEEEIVRGHIYSLQNASGKLYWKEDYADDVPVKIKCVNTDSSNPQTLVTLQDPDILFTIEFLIAGNMIYYTIGYDLEYSDLYRMDLDGGNAKKLNRSKLGLVDKLFYDQGRLYFLAEDLEGELYDLLQTLDSKGEAVTFIKSFGYFPQDECAMEYCGISNNLFYFFDGNFDFHQFNLKTKRDGILFHQVEMGGSAIGTLFSIRGENIKNVGVIGLYILGNDIYFSPCENF